MVRMPLMSSSTRNTLQKSALSYDVLQASTHQLKPSRGFRGSGTIDCGMTAPRYVDAIDAPHHDSATKVCIVVV